MRISIIIPTRDRARYLKHTLAAAMKIEDPDLEILVSDNASFDDTEEMVARIRDPRVRYTNTGARLSMRQNFEHALKQSTGDYVVFHGDDDGIVPGQFPFLRRILQDNEPDALSWDYPVFAWSVDETKVKEKGFRLVRSKLFGVPRPLDGEVLRRTLESGQIDRHLAMPQLYHGCISKSFLLSLARADGEIILARSPDTYISYRAVQRGGRFFHCHHPFSINGTSPVSNGGTLSQSVARAAKATTQNSFGADNLVDPIENALPYVRSVPCDMLNTLECVRTTFPEPALRPDYASWYTEALVDMRKRNAETCAQLMEILATHAVEHGQEAALATAQGRFGKLKRRLTKSWLRNRGKQHSLRAATGEDGAKTMYDALEMCDALLGTDLGKVLDGTLTRDEAWRASQARWTDGQWRKAPVSVET